MIGILKLVLLLFTARSVHGLIVPEEVPSLLSLVYSNIPPIKKGTDSRLGWGFRLGEHADFQIMVELGPQTNTRPLGNEKDKNTGDTKRGVPNNLRNYLWAQNQLLKQKQQKEQISDSEGGKWIKNWSSYIRNQEEPEEGIGEIDASQVIPGDLEELYGKPKKQNPTTDEVSPEEAQKIKELFKVIAEEAKKFETTTQKFKTTTDPKDALDNVEMDE